MSEDSTPTACCVPRTAASHPSKNSPHPQPRCVSTVVAFLPFSPAAILCCSPKLTTLALSRFPVTENLDRSRSAHASTEVLTVAHDNCRANHSHDSYRGCSHTELAETISHHDRRSARSTPSAAHRPKSLQTTSGLAVNLHPEGCTFVESTPPRLRLPTLVLPPACFSVPRSGVFNSKALLHR